MAFVFLDILATFLSDFAVLTLDLRAWRSFALVSLLSCRFSTRLILVSSSKTPFVNDNPLSANCNNSSVFELASKPASTRVSRPCPTILHPPRTGLYVDLADFIASL
eukprot:Lithocolla_globosa_v1_NODE_15_length_10543_cov_26.361651.p10 type:complete len:107 gc:universal NODE_15_length_10543_cov_26.361651:7550-7870(+)